MAKLTKSQGRRGRKTLAEGPASHSWSRTAESEGFYLHLNTHCEGKLNRFTIELDRDEAIAFAVYVAKIDTSKNRKNREPENRTSIKCLIDLAQSLADTFQG